MHRWCRLKHPTKPVVHRLPTYLQFLSDPRNRNFPLDAGPSEPDTKQFAVCFLIPFDQVYAVAHG